MTAPARVPGDQENKVAEVTHFTSRGVRLGDGGREGTLLRTHPRGSFRQDESKEKLSPEG